MKDTVIFDLDGTLADIQHRRPFIEGDDKDWDAFYDACVKDVPIPAVIEVLSTHLCHGHPVRIVTGRSDRVREQTIKWLVDHCGGVPSWWDAMLIMRPQGDFRPDVTFKRELLDGVIDRDSILCVYEDRSRVVAMWRSEGIPCFQVCDGDY